MRKLDGKVGKPGEVAKAALFRASSDSSFVTGARAVRRRRPGPGLIASSATEDTITMTAILLLGASGLVGGESLRIALNKNDVSKIVAPTRRALPAHPKLVNPVSSTLESFVPE